ERSADRQRCRPPLGPYLGTTRARTPTMPPSEQGSDLSGGMMNRHTARWDMPKAKIAITLDRAVLTELDELIAQRRFPNRSQAIEDAIVEKLGRLARRRLAAELERLDPAQEKALAEEGWRSELAAWPEY